MENTQATVRDIQGAREVVRELLRKAFPVSLSGPRRLGKEDEYQVVGLDGNMADVRPLFGDLIALGWKPKHDAVTNELIGASSDGVEIGLDVGIGTLEVAYPHVGNLFDQIGKEDQILTLVDGLLSRRKMHRLRDYAVQPLTVPMFDHWAPKGRGQVFRTLFPSEVHVQTASSASQFHLDVTHTELCGALEVFLSLSPVIIALNANSPIWGGNLDPFGMLAARQHFWERFTCGEYWQNVFVGSAAHEEYAPSSFDVLSTIIGNAPFIVRVHEGKTEVPNMSFVEWLARHSEELDEQGIRSAMLDHEGTLWWEVRPRVAYGTIEVRPACQNKDSIASAALALGLMENLEESLDFVRISRSYGKWRLLQRQALRNGLHGGDVSAVAECVLKLARTGLERRNLGEQELLSPLIERVRTRMSPGHVKRELFKSGGIPVLLDRLLIG